MEIERREVHGADVDAAATAQTGLLGILGGEVHVFRRGDILPEDIEEALRRAGICVGVTAALVSVSAAVWRMKPPAAKRRRRS